MRALEDAIGALLGIPIHYYARLDFAGFIKMVDAVGGVDVTVDRGSRTRRYDGYGVGRRGFSITAGEHHLDGAEALAYARSRKGVGESDFTRQARQQQILVALRDQATRGGSLLFELPDLLDAVGETIRSDIPVERLPALAAILEEVGRKRRHERRHPCTAGEGPKHPLRRFAGARPGPHPGDGGRAVLRPGGAAGAVADAEADEAAEGDPKATPTAAS